MTLLLTSSFLLLLLVAVPGATSSILAPSSDVLVTSSMSLKNDFCQVLDVEAVRARLAPNESDTTSASSQRVGSLWDQEFD